MMKAHPKVSQYTVHLLNAVIVHEVRQVAEVRPHEREALIVKAVGVRIEVLIQAVQTVARTQTLHDGTAVTATAERHIHVDLRLTIRRI